MRILLLIRSLEAGGAEAQCALLAAGLRAAGNEVSVVVLYPGGRFEADLERARVPIRSLDKRGRGDFASVLWRLVRRVRDERPEVLYTSLTAANLLGAALRPLFPKLPIVWTLRASRMDLDRYDSWTRFTSALEPWLARCSDRIVVNSRAGLEHAAATGFSRAALRLVRNGIDIGRFARDATGRLGVRSEWGIGDGEKLVGLVGRIDPMKDHRTFLAAAKQLGERRGDVRFVCVGDGRDPYRTEVRRFADGLGLGSRLLWAGLRSDLPEVYSALDVLVLSSEFGEGLPNVVAEAMACGTRCVVTDVGDAAWIVGETGRVVPPSSPEALAGAIETSLHGDPTDEERARLRSRIVENLGVERLVRETSEIFHEVVAKR